MNKICSKCKVEKDVSEFSKRPERKSGIRSSCKKCKSIQTSKKYREDKSNSPVELWLCKNLHNCKYRAKKQKIKFSISIDNLRNLLDTQCKKCIFCSNDLNFNGTIDDRMLSPTIDRLIPHFGYVGDNIVISCYRCNAIKNNATYEELRNISDVLKSLIESRGTHA